MIVCEVTVYWHFMSDVFLNFPLFFHFTTVLYFWLNGIINLSRKKNNVLICTSFVNIYNKTD